MIVTEAMGGRIVDKLRIWNWEFSTLDFQILDSLPASSAAAARASAASSAAASSAARGRRRGDAGRERARGDGPRARGARAAERAPAARPTAGAGPDEERGRGRSRTRRRMRPLRRPIRRRARGTTDRPRDESPNATMYGNHASSSRGVGLAQLPGEVVAARRREPCVARSCCGPFFVIAIWSRLHTIPMRRASSAASIQRPVLCASRRPWNGEVDEAAPAPTGTGRE